VRLSDTALVTEAGPELFTKHPTELQALMLRGAGLLSRWRGRLVRRTMRVD
jgi:hypothetical protein